MGFHECTKGEAGRQGVRQRALPVRMESPPARGRIRRFSAGTAAAAARQIAGAPTAEPRGRIRTYCSEVGRCFPPLARSPGLTQNHLQPWHSVSH